MHDNTTDTARLRLQRRTDESEAEPDEIQRYHFSGSAVGRSRRRQADSTPRRLAALFDDDVRTLPSPVMLTTRTGDRYRLIASSPTAGVLQAVGGAPELGWNTRLALVPEDNHLRTVRAVVQVVEDDFTDSRGALSRVVWLAVTATGRRAYLVEALEQMLGVRARLSGNQDRLEPNRQLVYNPSRKCVNLVTIGAEALPRPRAGSPSSPRVRVPTGQSPQTPHDGPNSGAFVLVDDTNPLPERRTHSGHEHPPMEPPALPSRQRHHEHATFESGKTQRVPTDQLAAVKPMVRVHDSGGCFTVGGELRAMSCRWAGRTHLIFSTTVEAVNGLRPGVMLSMGIVSPPGDGPLVWVVGEVSSLQADSDRVVVEVDLRRGGDVPAPYEHLVRYWDARSDGREPSTAR